MGRPFVIARPGPGEGFFSNVLFALDGIAYARTWGWSPVVDMERQATRYRVADGNDWERYFAQPSGLTVGEAVRAGARTIAGERTGLFSGLYASPIPRGATAALLRVPVRRWLGPTPLVTAAVRRALAETGLQPRRYVAVHYRGTDMLGTPDHPVPVPIERYLAAAEEARSAAGVRAVFLATDDLGAVARFRERFGADLRTLEATRTGDGTAVHAAGDRSDLGLQVLVDALLLGRGATLVAGRSNVAVAAVLLAPAPLRVVELTPTRHGDGSLVPRRSPRTVLLRRLGSAAVRTVQMRLGGHPRAADDGT